MRRQKLYDGKEDMSYNQTCSKGEREEKSPQAASKQHVHPSPARCCCCPGMGLQGHSGIVSRWPWLGRTRGRVGGKEEGPSCQNVLPWLCSQEETSLSSSVSKGTLDVDLLARDLQACMK